MFSCSKCCGGRCCEMQCCEMLFLDDGYREEYLCVERIICEGCKKVTWLNGLFNIYIPVCTMITPYVPLVLRENLEKVGNPRHKKKCREQICVGTTWQSRPKMPTFGCRADMSPTCRQLSQPSIHSPSTSPSKF